MTDYFAFAAENARTEFHPSADLAHRETHPCGGCGRPAQFFDRSVTSGAMLFVCFVCGDPAGHPTLVFPRFAPMDATRAGEA